MKKHNSHLVTGSKMALVATMIASPMIATAQEASAPKSKPAASSTAASRTATSKVSATAEVVGKDPKGRTILKNSRGETFYLEPGTGKMVFVKWPAAKAPASQKK